MISWVRPQILIPVHGEPLHMAEHAGLARRAGVGKVLTCRNGDLVKLAPDGPAIIDEVPAGRLYKDGSLLVDAAERTVPDRRRLGFAGIVSVALAITDRGELVGDPDIELTGIPDKDADGNLIARAGARRGARGHRTRCRARAGAIRTRSPKRRAAPCAPPSARPGTRSRCAMCTC